MTKTTCKLSFAIALVLFGTLLAGPVQADRSRMRVDVPFRFLAGDVMMPAGSYTVDLVENTRTMSLTSWQKATVVPVNSPGVRRPASPNGKGALEFEKISGTYVLRSAWNPDQTIGCAVYRSRRFERESAAAKKGEIVIALAR